MCQAIEMKIGSPLVSMELMSRDARLPQIPKTLRDMFDKAFNALKGLQQEAKDAKSALDATKLSIGSAKDCAPAVAEAKRVEALIKVMFVTLERAG